MIESVQRLRDHLAPMQDVVKTINVLNWDKDTYMPRGGVSARARQVATLSALAHTMLTDTQTGHLLAEAQNSVENAQAAADSLDGALVRIVTRDRERALRIPTWLIADLAAVSGNARDAWADARARNDYASFAPWLQRHLDLTRTLIDYIGYTERPADALIDRNEPGMTTNTVASLFGDLKGALVPMIRTLAPFQHDDRDAVLRRGFDEKTQLSFAHGIAAGFGYDFARGRLDLTAHPFETAFSRNDVRITTRVDHTFFSKALMGVMHETGHGLYEQGISPDLDRTPLARGTSPGLHESQSRLWENVVGRSWAFWQSCYPRLQSTFPNALSDVTAETFYRAINTVRPSLIRVEADEMTYSLHIILRFELENELLEGRLSVAELPAAWAAKMEDYLGIVPATDTEGCLQDVHWSLYFGGFPGYALGNIMSVQIFNAACAALPTLEEEIAQGRTASLLAWLQDHIYRFGRIYDPADLLHRATGEHLSITPYITYLRHKFSDIYRVRL